MNEDIELSASGTDAGSDDLVFDWSIGEINTYFNNGVDPDPADSPFGIFPFEVLDETVTGNFDMPGVVDLLLTLTDDDGASDSADENIIVTGDADQTRGQGWWKHQFSGSGAAHIDADIAQAYLDIVNAVSSIFSEQVSSQDAAEAHVVLSPKPSDTRGRAEQALLEAWLEFASGAVAVDAIIPLGGKDTAIYLALMFDAEAIIANGSASKNQLNAIEKQLKKVQQASP